MAGFSSNVCTKLGLIASLNKIAIAFSAFKSRAKIGWLSKVNPMKISPNRFFKFSKSVAIHKIAITSDAGVILKPSSLGIPLTVPPKPIIMLRKARSFISITRFQTTVLASIFKLLTELCKLLSIKADNKLFAFSTALKSPVK